MKAEWQIGAVKGKKSTHNQSNSGSRDCVASCCLEGKIVKVKCVEEKVTQVFLLRQSQKECSFKVCLGRY